MKTTKEKRVSKNKAPAAWSSEERDIATVIPYEKNPRKNDQAVGAVAESIRQFGFRQPIVVDAQGVIIAGHTRLKAAQLLGLPKVPVHVAKELTPEQVRALRIADNKLHELAQWDVGILASELEGLVGMEALGFDENELKEIAFGRDAQRGLSDPDAVPEAPKEPVSKPGDIWVLGNHRLMCGDSRKAEDVARLMDGVKADLCFTSPPYAQQRDYDGDTKEVVQDWYALMCGVFSNLPMSDRGQVLVNLGIVHRDGQWEPYWDQWIVWMVSRGWKRFGWYVWDQGFGLPGDWNGRLAPSHEFVFHFNSEAVRPEKWMDKKPENIKPRNDGESTMRGKDGKTKKFTNPGASGQPTKIPDSVIRVGRQVGSDGHPAQFPVSLPEFVMKSWGGVAYEPFSGAGTTIIAAEKLGRKCYGMEISPAYVDVAVARWEKFTGRKAERATG